MRKCSPVDGAVPNLATGVDPVELARVRAKVKDHLTAGRPLEELGITPTKPADGIKFAFVHPTPRIIGTAKTPDRSRWRRCSYCETERKWIDGSIVLCGDGELRLIGPDCWHTHIDEQDWAVATEEYEQYQRVERFKTARDSYFPAIRTLQAEIRVSRIESADSLAFADKFWSTFQSRFPDLARELEKSHRDDDRLLVERSVTNYGAFEGTRGQAEADRIDDRVRLRFAAHMVHRLVGGSTMDIRPGAVSRMLDDAFKTANLAMQFTELNWEAMTSGKFDAAAKDFETACQRTVNACGNVLSAMRAVASFMSAANLQGIVRWANDGDCELCLGKDAGKYEAVKDGLVMETGDGRRAEYRLLADFRLPRLMHLDTVRDLVSKRRISKHQRAA